MDLFSAKGKECSPDKMTTPKKCDCVEGSYMDDDCITTCDKCKHRTRKCVECEWCLLREAMDTPDDKRTPTQKERIKDFIATAKHLGVAS